MGILNVCRFQSLLFHIAKRLSWVNWPSQGFRQNLCKSMLLLLFSVDVFLDNFKFIKYVLVSMYSLLDSLRSVTNDQRRPSLLACAGGRAATLVLDAALVASQWQHPT